MIYKRKELNSLFSVTEDLFLDPSDPESSEKYTAFVKDHYLDRKYKYTKVYVCPVCPKQNCESRIMEHHLIHWNKRVKVGLQTVLYCGCGEVPEMHYHCPNVGCLKPYTKKKHPFQSAFVRIIPQLTTNLCNQKQLPHQ